jgi:hypothetical protein
MPLGGQQNLARGTNPKGKVDGAPSQTFVRLNKQPYKSQLGSKMIKNEGDDMGKVEDKNVIS